MSDGTAQCWGDNEWGQLGDGTLLVAFGNGYLMVASDGGVFDFSDKPFFGSLASHPPRAPIVGIAAFATK